MSLVAIGRHRRIAARVMGPPFVVASAIAALLLLPLLDNQPLIIRGTDMLIFVLFVASLNLLVGYAGMVSMGHAAFFATGGYITAILAKHFDVVMPLALAAGPLTAALLAAVIGFFSIRLTHAYFIMLTLAFAQLVYTVIWKWQELTGGDDGLIGFGPPAFLADTTAYYYFTLVVIVVCLFLLYRLGQSPFGQMLTAIRDNPGRVTFIGVNVRSCQLAAFVIAGFFAGMAGSLQAFFHRGMFPDSAHFITSADALVVVVLGGTRHFAGPIIGAVVFKALVITVPAVTPYWPLFLGLVILAVTLFMPSGLIGLLDRWIGRERRLG